MNTISGVRTRKQVLDLVCRIVEREGESNIELRAKPAFILLRSTAKNKRLLSSMKGHGDQYLVQVDISISDALSLPLWRDEP